MPNHPSPPNQLAGEKSPYLLQHATNPVDWYPWGDAAFARARTETKPIFLSIGYSTCHWCHVMERESFTDPEVARLLNDGFICIKVDREERPDIDALYMDACQLLTGSGGWPLTIIMTPDRQPFYAATYIPKTDRYGREGMRGLLPRIGKLWATHRAGVVTAAGRMHTELQRLAAGQPAAELNPELLASAFDYFHQMFDAQDGGFGAAPKFPTPHQYMFLLRYWRRSCKSRALAMVETSLAAMARGGICDHLGFGFHRYATDARWLVPHYEKMLYDQALLALACLETYAATANPEYRRTAEEIFTYVLRDLAAPDGGFASAEDADVGDEEGAFYLWTRAGLKTLLTPDELALFAAVFDLAPAEPGRHPDQSFATTAGVLHQTQSWTDAARALGTDEDTLRARWEPVRDKLFTARSARPRPGRDDKVLTDWNGLMIAALARGGFVLDEPRYTTAAAQAAAFIRGRLVTADGRLLHRYRDGEAAIVGMLDDYAFLIWGWLELHQATHNPEYLREALAWQARQDQWFRDDAGGGYFTTATDGEPLPVRRKDTSDGAIPAGNSVALTNLLRLAALTGNPALAEQAARLMNAGSGAVAPSPAAHTFFLGGLDYALGPSSEVVIVGNPGREDTQAMLQLLRRRFLPRLVLLVKPATTPSPILSEIAPYTDAMTAMDGRATAYVCQRNVCRRPVTDPGELAKLLDTDGE